MATASEIRVTEAYIGLFNRAPNPEGLAYWVKQLDEAGGTTDAMKKLTNDMTLNTEWTVDGLGSYQETDGSVKAAGAEEIVKGMYLNLFERPATEADITYWSGELVAGDTTASEMVIQLITAAKEKANADADTLAIKEEAASYYVSKVSEDDFTRTTAKAAVEGVDSPNTLADSKANSDAIASGVGKTTALTTGNDVASMTGGDDTVTGTDLTMGNAGTNIDKIADGSTSDSDTLTITGTDGFTFGAVTNVENINVSLSKQFGSTFTVNAAALSGGDLALTTAKTVDVFGEDVAGSTTVVIQNGSSDVTTTGVSNLQLDMLDTHKTATTVSGDASLTTLVVLDANDAGVSVTLANDAAGQSVTVGGVDGTNDAASISANVAVSLDVDRDHDVDLLTLSGNTNDVNYTVTDSASALDVTFAGSKSVTLTLDANDAEALSTTDSLTAGKTNVVLTGIYSANDLDLTGVNTDTVTVSNDIVATAVEFNDSQAIVVTAGQATALDLHQKNGNDGTVSLTLSSETTSFTNASLATDGFANITVNAGDLAVTGLAINAAPVSNNDANIVVVGTNDIAGAAVAAGDATVKISADKLTLTGSVTGASIDIDVTNDISVDGVAAGAGAVTIDATGNDGAIVSTESITAQTGAGNDVTINGETLTVNTVGDTDDITADDVTIDLSNDTAVSAITGIITGANDVTVTGGNLDVSQAITATAGDIAIGSTADVASGGLSAGDTITISGSAKVTTSTSDADNGILITSSGDVNLGSFTGQNVVARTATGDITVTNTDGGTGVILLATGSGDDALTANDTVVHTVESGGGNDAVTITAAGATSSFKTGAGIDAVTLSTANDVTIDLGLGDDTISVVADSEATIDGGDGNDTMTLATGNYADDGLSFTNIETVTHTAAVSISAAQLANDNTFELNGGSTLTIVGATGVANTMDASGVTGTIENTSAVTFTGSTKVDTVTGSNMVDTVNAGAGDDIISGGGNLDILNGGDGNDTINGGDSNDTINGGNDADILKGDGGADIITGGLGKDVITGGAGNDKIVRNGDGTTDGLDTVLDFNDSGFDQIDLTTNAANDNEAASTGYIEVAVGATTVTDGAGLVVFSNEITVADATTGPTEAEIETYLGTSQVFRSQKATDAIYVAASDGTNTYLLLLESSGTNKVYTAGEDVGTVMMILTGLDDADGDLAAGNFTDFS